MNKKDWSITDINIAVKSSVKFRTDIALNIDTYYLGKYSNCLNNKHLYTYSYRETQGILPRILDLRPTNIYIATLAIKGFRFILMEMNASS